MPHLSKLQRERRNRAKVHEEISLATLPTQEIWEMFLKAREELARRHEIKPGERTEPKPPEGK